MKSKISTIIILITFLLSFQNIFSQTVLNELSPKMKIMAEMIKVKSSVKNNRLYKVAGTASLLDSAITYDTDGNIIKYFYTYNSDGYLLSQNNAVLTDGVFENDIRTSYTYDSDNNMISGSGSMWSNGEWIEIMRSTAEYNNGIIAEEQSELLMGDEWITISSSTYTYDTASRTLVEVSSGSFSSYSERITETYDEKGNLISVLEESETDGEWYKIELTEYTYNSNNQETEDLGYIWDGSQWVYSSRYVSTYNANNNRTEELFQYWYDGEWISSQKNIISFNDNNYMTEYLSSYWGDGEWVEYWKYIYEYNADGSSFHGTSVALVNDSWETYPGEFYFFGSKGYYNDDSHTYLLDAAEINAYFSVITDVEEKEDNILPSDFVLEQNYPNPFNPTTVISYQLASNSDVKLKVFDVLGKEVSVLVNEQKPAGNYTVEFDASGLTSGIYFYRLSAGNTFLTKKMLLLR